MIRLSLNLYCLFAFRCDFYNCLFGIIALVIIRIYFVKQMHKVIFTFAIIIFFIQFIHTIDPKKFVSILVSEHVIPQIKQNLFDSLSVL